MKEKSKIVISFIIAALLGFSVGWVIGSLVILNWGTDTALRILNMNGTIINIDAGDLAQGVWRYKSHIG